MRISPAVGTRKPAMILSSVDLPQPEGPTMQRNSEASMSKLTPATPGTSPAGEIRIGGKAVSGHGPDRGVVFQDFAQLFPWRPALGNGTFGLGMRGAREAERQEMRPAEP